MNRLKLPFLGVLALGVLLGPFILSIGRMSYSNAQDASKAKAQTREVTNSAISDERDHLAERAAIAKATQAFVDAYSSSEVDRVATHLAEGVELISDDAPPLRGRDAIQKTLKNYFAENPPKKITREVEAVRFTSKHSAVEVGNLKVAEGSGAAKNMRYSLRLVEEDGKWLITVIQEWPSEIGDLMDLEFLIGSWEAIRPDAEFRTTYEWFGDKSFIRATMNVRQKDRSFTTMQMIGIDPRTEELRVWVFETNGGFAEGTCNREGNTWIFDTRGVLKDGDDVSATNILVRVSGDTITWQPVNMTVGDEQVGNLPPVKVTRVKPTR